MLSLPYPFPERDYSFFRRGEEGSLLGANVAYSDSYVVVGANGYSEFEGLVQVFSTMNSSISHVANINAPLNSIESSDFNIYGRNINFGVSTGIDEINDSIIIGAIGYALHTGKAFIYVSNFNDVNIEQRWQLHTILDSPVQQMGHGFGYTVCMFDTFAVVGTTSSTVYIYRLQNDQWNLVWTLSAENDPTSAFGSSLSLYNRTLVIGDHGRGARGGRVYVYTIKEVENGEITVDLDTEFTENIEFESTTNFFGKAIQIHLDSMVIGAPHKLLEGQVTLQTTESPPPQQGAAYIYERMNGSWVNTANLSSFVDEHSLFGASVSIRNNMAVIGAYAYGNNSGCAFWYRKDPVSEQWDLANSFPSPLYQNDSGFGYSVGVGIDSIAIGAYTQDQLSGAIYITSILEYGAPTLMPTTLGNGAIQTIFDAKGSGITLTALSWLVLCAIFVLVMIAFLVIGVCCCCPNIFVFAGKKRDEKKEIGRHGSSDTFHYADMATVQLIATVDNSGERIPPGTDHWLAVSEVEETDFIVQGAGLVTNSAPPAPSMQGVSPTAHDNELHLLHNHFVLSDPLDSAHLPPKRKADSSVIQKAATFFRNGIKRVLPATDSSYSIEERQLERSISIFSDTNSSSSPPRPRPRGNSTGEGTPRSAGRVLPIPTSAYSLFKEQDKNKPSIPSPDLPDTHRKSFVRPAKTAVKRLSNVDISPFSSFSTRHSQSSDISTLSLSSTSSMGGLSASFEMQDSNLPFDRSNYRPSIAEPSFNNHPIAAPPPMYQVGRATANGGFALKDKNLPPLPSPTPPRRPDHISPPSISNSPSKFPSIDPGVSANRPSALEIGLYNDYTKTKNLYQAFRKEVNSQMNFQLENLYDDESNCSSRSLMQDEGDDSSSIGGSSRSPSPAPFRSLEQVDFHTPPKVGAGTGIGAKLSPLPKTPPISQPDVNFYMTSPEEREIHTQLRVETKARYLEFKAHVGSLLSESPSPNSSVTKFSGRGEPKVRATPSTASNTPLTPRSSDSPVSMILSNSFYHTESDDVFIMVENEMRSTLIQQQYPSMDEEVPMQTNALRFTEYREQYPPTELSIPEEQNMLRQRVLLTQKPRDGSGRGAAPTVADTLFSAAGDSNPERGINLRYRAAKANYRRFREKLDADNKSNDDEHNSPT